jgi:trehalose/maltose hydrolase-like predicted phosphorylase
VLCVLARGTAAWHVNADIAMAFERYRVVTGDDSLEAECGLVVLVETARLWLSLGTTTATASGISTASQGPTSTPHSCATTSSPI